MQDATHETRGGEARRLILVGLAALGVGYAAGFRTAPTTLRPPEEPAARVPSPSPAIPASIASDEVALLAPPPSSPPAPSTSATPRAPASTGPDVERVPAELAALDRELAPLARALSHPEERRSLRAVLDDLASYESVRARRDSVARLVPAEVAKAPPEPPASVRERARALERAGAFVVSARGVPQDVRYLDVPAPTLGGGETVRAVGVALGLPGSARLHFRTQRGPVVRAVSVFEDEARGRDVLRVEYGDADGPPRIVRACELGPCGETWRWAVARLFERGALEHDELEELVARPLARAPRPGWIDWVRRHVDLPRNRDLGEDYGPAPPLTRANPLLLTDARARPAFLERPDLVIDAERREPPIAIVGRGPFVLVAANAVGVYDTAWRWLVFDAVRRRVVDHAELTAGQVEHVRWDFYPEPERFPQARRGDLIDALLATALERTRQAMTLITLPGEVADLALDLRRKVGGGLSSDGLEAMRLRTEVVDRMKRLDALAHLLLDEDGISHYERALDRSKIETMQLIVDLIVRMIEEGRDGPAEYLLRDDRVKSLLFHPPAGRTERERLRKLFRERFRPWSVRLRRSLAGLPTQWYEEEGGG